MNKQEEDSSEFEKLTYQKKVSMINGHFPPLTLEKWNKLTLTEQYEMVFHPNKDPAKSKPSEVPYFIRVVNRRCEDKKKGEMCSYCKRKLCENCPLPFNDKVTLRSFLLTAKININSFWFYGG